MNNLRPGANVVSWWLGRKPDAVLYFWLGKKKNYCQHSKFWAIVRAKLFILQMDFFLSLGMMYSWLLVWYNIY